MGSSLFSNNFLVQFPPKSPRCVVFLFKARRINGLGPCGDHRASLPCLTRRRSVSEFQRRGPSYVGPRVRISLPPGESHVRTRRSPTSYVKPRDRVSSRAPGGRSLAKDVVCTWDLLTGKSSD